jgi:hypothetical protein
VSANEELAGVVRQLADLAVEQLINDPESRYLVFERLGRFGSVIVRPLEAALSRTDDEEVQVLVGAALLLLLGSTSGVPILRRAVQPQHPYVCLAAKILAEAHDERAGSIIEEALRPCDIANVQVLECLVAALRRLGRGLPGDVQSRLAQIEPAWLRESLLG